MDESDISGFLKARWAERAQQLDEDERVALAANAGGGWQYSTGDSVGAWTLYDQEWEIASLKTYRHESYDYAARMPAFRHPGYVDADANGEHIARFDPQRMLAEVQLGRQDIAAKRRILDEYDTTCGEVRNPTSAEHRANARARQFALEQVIAYLAQPYAGQPGWRTEWAL